MYICKENKHENGLRRIKHLKDKTMKKLLVLLLVLTPVFAKANPIAVGIILSEISFDESGDWSLEILNRYTDSLLRYDIYIETCSGTAKIISLDSVSDFDYYGYIVITNKNLSKSLTINKDYDCIKLITSPNFVIGNDSVCLGNYPGSYLKNITNGQSIACIDEYGSFYKDNTPTMGARNDLSGAVGQIYGHVYGLNNQLMTNKYFYIDEGNCEGSIDIDEKGSYSAKITSRVYSISELYICTNTPKYHSELVQFKPVHFDLEENDSIRVDFVQTIASVEKTNQESVLLSNYPNPAKDFTYFIFDTDKDLSSLLITVYDLEGRKVDSFIPGSTKQVWNCSKLAQGTYVYALSCGNQLLGTNKFQVIK